MTVKGAWLAVIIDAFKDSGLAIGIFDGVPSAPDRKLIRELFNIYRDRGHDAVIAVGGGSVADTAKMLNIAVSGKPEDIEGCAGENLIKETSEASNPRADLSRHRL